MDRSASLDLDMINVGDQTDAGPALGLHLVEVFHAGHVSHCIGPSSISGLFAGGVGASEIVDAGDLHGLSALLGTGKVSKHCQDGESEDGFHLNNISEQSWPFNIIRKATYKYAFHRCSSAA